MPTSHPLFLAALGICVSCGSAETRAAPSSLPPAQVAEDFWAYWGDGRAEIDSYTLVTPRYGELREGTAVLVYVTEDFTDGQRVKSDGGHGDEFPVLKLNEVRAFQTGIYDYRITTSSFVRLDGQDPLGRPVKVSMGMQEWCGHVYSQLVPRGSAATLVTHSYFDGEADAESRIEIPADGVMLDALPITVRGLTGAWEGALRVSVFQSLMRARFEHRPPGWVGATLTRGPSSTITVPAGSFPVAAVELRTDAGLVVTWQVEQAAPHRLIRWSTSDGEVAELVASERLPYWTMNGPGAEAALGSLGLEPVGVPSR